MISIMKAKWSKFLCDRAMKKNMYVKVLLDQHAEIKLKLIDLETKRKADSEHLTSRVEQLKSDIQKWTAPRMEYLNLLEENLKTTVRRLDLLETKMEELDKEVFEVEKDCISRVVKLRKDIGDSLNYDYPTTKKKVKTPRKSKKD